MNFDDIKNNWDKENTTATKIPAAINTLRKAQHPIDQLRASMKKEFYSQVLAVVAMPFFIGFITGQKTLFLCFYILFAAISAYYLYHFYKFYKDMHNYNTDTRDGLLELYYQLRLNMERYKSFGFLLVPFIFIFLGFIEIKSKTSGPVSLLALLDKYPYVMVGLVTGVSIVYILIIVAWVKSFYGKYAAQIKNVLDELKEEHV